MNLTYNCSNLLFSVVMKPISCFLRIEKVVLIFILTNSNCSFHGKSIGRSRLFVLLPAEMYLQFFNLSLFSLNEGKSVHTVKICYDRWIDSFILTFLNTVGCNHILSGKNNTNTLFSNSFFVYRKLKNEVSSMQFWVNWFGRRQKALFRFS